MRSHQAVCIQGGETMSGEAEPGASMADASTQGTAAARAALAVPPLPSKAEDQRGLLGLRNMGNTCYLNSAVQCLSQTASLLQSLQRDADRAQLGAVSRAFLATIRSLWSASTLEPAVPGQLKACISAASASNEIFAGSSQQDAQEFLQALLEALDRDLTDSQEAEGPSLVSEILEGQLCSEVRCSGCQGVNQTCDSFWSLPLPLPPTGRASLASVLATFCREEALEEADNWRCESCTSHSAERRFMLRRLPNVLQLHLKRFQWKAPQEPTLPVTERAAGAAGTAGQGQSPTPEPPVKVAKASEPVARAEHAEDEQTEAAAAVTSTADLADMTPLQRTARLSWEQQQKLYGLLLRVLERIRDSPDDAKLRSISATAKSLRSDVLEVDGGPELLQWAGFQPVGDRFQADAAALGTELAASRHAELQAHALQERDANFRRERDARIEAERQRRLPTGDTGPPLRRWGGRLPSFGRGARSFADCGLQCSKISTRVELQADPDNPRGLKPLDVSCMLEEGAKQNGTTYELYAVVQHLGATPFSGHYVAYCWHPPSCSWWCFDDSSVRRVDASRIGDEALNDGAYVLFLEKSKTHEEATAVSKDTRPVRAEQLRPVPSASCPSCALAKTLDEGGGASAIVGGAHFPTVLRPRSSGRDFSVLATAFDMTVGDQLISEGRWMQPEVDLLKAFLPVGGVAVDAGANIGGFALPLSKHVGPDGQVHAFEPFRNIFQVLTANCAINGLLSCFTYHNALGNATEQRRRPMPGLGAVGNPSKSFVVDEIASELLVHHDSLGRSETVSVVRLDDKLKLDRLDVMKIDVESGEYDMLLGAGATIRAHQPLIYVEDSESDKPPPTRVMRLLSDLHSYWCADPKEFGLQLMTSTLCVPQRMVGEIRDRIRKIRWTGPPR
eukprot:s1051_g11.t1